MSTSRPSSRSCPRTSTGASSRCTTPAREAASTSIRTWAHALLRTSVTAPAASRRRHPQIGTGAAFGGVGQPGATGQAQEEGEGKEQAPPSQAPRAPPGESPKWLTGKGIKETTRMNNADRDDGSDEVPPWEGELIAPRHPRPRGSARRTLPLERSGAGLRRYQRIHHGTRRHTGRRASRRADFDSGDTAKPSTQFAPPSPMRLPGPPQRHQSIPHRVDRRSPRDPCSLRLRPVFKCGPEPSCIRASASTGGNRVRDPRLQRGPHPKRSGPLTAFRFPLVGLADLPGFAPAPRATTDSTCKPHRLPPALDLRQEITSGACPADPIARCQRRTPRRVRDPVGPSKEPNPSKNRVEEGVTGAPAHKGPFLQSPTDLRRAANPIMRNRRLPTRACPRSYPWPATTGCEQLDLQPEPDGDSRPPTRPTPRRGSTSTSGCRRTPEPDRRPPLGDQVDDGDPAEGFSINSERRRRQGQLLGRRTAIGTRRRPTARSSRRSAR